MLTVVQNAGNFAADDLSAGGRSLIDEIVRDAPGGCSRQRCRPRSPITSTALTVSPTRTGTVWSSATGITANGKW